MEKEKKPLTQVHDNKKDELKDTDPINKEETKLPKDIADKEEKWEDSFSEEKQKPWEKEKRSWIPLIILLIIFIAIGYWALFSNNTEEDSDLSEDPATAEIVTELPEIADMEESYPIPVEEAVITPEETEEEYKEEILKQVQDDNYAPGSKVPNKNVNDTVPAELKLCTMNLVAGLEIKLQDLNGNPLTNAVITVNNNKFSEWNNGIYSGLNEEAGIFTFKINKNGFKYYEETVTITENECHVNTVNKTITLIPLN